MDRTSTLSGTNPAAGGANPMPGNPALGGANPMPGSARVENAAMTAHQTVDKVADKATAQVDRLSGSAHRAVNSAADVATSAAEWASSLPQQAKEVQTRVTEAACTSIRAHPLTTVAGALVVGYLLGRLARL